MNPDGDGFERFGGEIVGKVGFGESGIKEGIGFGGA